MTGYAELQCASHFSFLRGASSAEELFAEAAVCGHHALAITDRNSLSGIVRAHEAAKVTGVRLIVGCRLILADGTDLLVYPTDRPAYARLCRLLSLGKGRAGKAQCELHWEDVADWSEGLISVLVPHQADDLTASRLRRLKQIFRRDAYLALTLRRRPRDHLRLHDLGNLATSIGVATVATNDVLFHVPGRRILQDVVTCNIGMRVRHRRLRKRLQAKGTRSAKRLLKKRSGKESRFAKDVNHRISKRIVSVAKRTDRAIAIEELGGIRNRVRLRRHQRENLHSWSFAQLGQFLRYKAIVAGVVLVGVDPRNTSRTCPACGHCEKANRLSQSRFLCVSCGFADLADYVAAVNIRARGRVAVMQPCVPEIVRPPSGGGQYVGTIAPGASPLL